MACDVHRDCLVIQCQIIVKHHLYHSQTKRPQYPIQKYKIGACRTFPHNRGLAKILERAMRRLRKSIEGLFERPPIEITLRLLIIRIASHINLISSSAEQGRREQPRDRAQQAHGEVDSARRGEAQLSCRRLVRVGGPGRRLSACDVLRVRLGDNCRVPRCVDFLYPI